MADLNSIKVKIAGMSEVASKMWQMTYKVFMEHDAVLIQPVLIEENKLNDLEKEITSELVEFARLTSSEQEKSIALIYADVVGDLELIGDYCKDILERVEIKIAENLLFSEEAVQEYTEIYHKTEEALKEIVNALSMQESYFLKKVLKNEEHIDAMIDQYRIRHNQRLVAGLCSPISCNMFLNMLDFTAAVYYHAKKIARNLLKIQ